MSDTQPAAGLLHPHHSKRKSDGSSSSLPFDSSPSSSTLSSYSLWSRMCFSWLQSLLKIGNARGHLELEDVNELSGHDATDRLAILFEKVWFDELQRSHLAQKEPSLLKALFRCFGWRYLSLGILKLVSDCLMFSGPVLLGFLVTFVESYDGHADSTKETSWHGYVYASAIVAGVLLNAICSSQYNFAIRRVGLHLRAVIVTAVYRKSLRISNTARRNFTAGQITNIMSVDTDRVQDICISFHELWSLPVQIAIALYLLYREVSWSLLAGLAVVVLLIPVNAVLTKKIQAVSKAMMAFKDTRVSLLEECIRLIRSIKFLSLENRFMREIERVRAQEMKQLTTRKYLDSLCVYFWATTPILVSLVTFSMYSYLLGHTLTSSKVFTSLALFNILIRPLNAFPWVINGLVEGQVSAQRVYRFLKSFEREDDGSQHEAKQITSVAQTHSSSSLNSSSSSHGHDAPTCVLCVEGTFDYILSKEKEEKEEDSKTKTDKIDVQVDEPSASSTSSSSPSAAAAPPTHALTDLSLHVHAGEFIGIHGLVGSGKSTLFLAVLGELSLHNDVRVGAPVSGGRSIHGRVAYVSQEVWLPNGTVRDNILFHQPYDAQRYRQVLHACALEPDLLVLASGDLTEVGEGGINLSGGQLMRLSLARACYASASADIFLFDDPLASVDAHVAAHLVTYVFGRNGVLRDKTRLLITHQIGIIMSQVDRLWTMEKGRVVKQQTREEVNKNKQQIIEELHEEVDAAATEQSAATVDTATSSSSSTANEAVVTDPQLTSPVAPVSLEVPDIDHTALEKGFLTAAESRARGSIRSKVLKAYLNYIGVGLCLIIVLSMFLMQGSRNACDWWLSYWVEKASDVEDAAGGSEDESASDAHYYLRIFAYLAAGNSVAALFRSFIFAYGGLIAARNLFKALLNAILFAPVVFFDQNPTGRILNRFSSDVYSIDENIPFQANIFLAQLFILIGSLTIICLVVPAILAILPLLTIAYYYIQRAYRCVSRELRRLDSTSRSPLYSNFSETLQGVVLIRAFGYEQIFQLQNRSILNKNQKIQFSNLGLNAWLNVRLQMIGVTMITFVSFLAILSCLFEIPYLKYVLNPSMIGLGIAYALPLTDTMNGLIGSFTDTEKEVVSVERTVEYIKVKSEDQLDKEADEHSMEDEEDEHEEKDDGIASTRRKQKTKTRGVNEDLESSLLSNPVESDAVVFASSLRAPLAAESWTHAALPPEWPARGGIRFDGVTLKYRPDLEPALDNFSLEVPPGKRIGIVGRTGSGKSTIFQALFRMRDISTGSISIDGRDISSIDRHELRSRLSIIPQAPVVFSGSIRANLLPHEIGDESTLSPAQTVDIDARLWPVLRQCHLEAKIRSLEYGSVHHVQNIASNNNNNFSAYDSSVVCCLLLGVVFSLSTQLSESVHFSVGERQLLAFARALLKKSRVIVLDEATASVDMETAAHIESLTLTLPSTILVIAHRLSSVLDMDRVLVMEKGRVAEFDSPNALLSNPKSIFAQLVRKANLNNQQDAH